MVTAGSPEGQADTDRNARHHRHGGNEHVQHQAENESERKGRQGERICEYADVVNRAEDSRSNQRTDNYGGSVDNRYRFLAEVMDAVLSVWDKEHVGGRLSPNGVFNDMGADDFRETFTFVDQQLNKLEIGYLHVMDGLAFGFHERGEAMTLAEFRALFDGMIIGNCGYTKEEAEKRLSDGDGDMIAFGRPWITNPDLPTRFKHDYPLESFDDPSSWYGGGVEGYNDFETYREKSGKDAMTSLT